ncbi:hypothetical protein VNI00_007673 [Paramarasmius palmivorus]|uniref:Uncharacterized protein n=1 Tax=Paramarasmius palmivorus TaxID=297713 RepID=A0AAW0D1X3_9AGAR
MAAFVAAAVAPLSYNWRRKRSRNSSGFDPERDITSTLSHIQTQLSSSSSLQSAPNRVTDAENLSISPVAAFGHGLQRYTSDVSERQLSRVPEETGESDGNGSELDIEDVERDLEEELEEQGFYAGSYKRLVALYTLAPITFVVVFVVLALVPDLIYSLEDEASPIGDYPYAHYIPFPIPEILVAGGIWSLAYLLNDLVFDLSCWLCNITHKLSFFCTHPSQVIPSPPSAAPAILLSRTIYAAITILLRLSLVPILLIPQYSVHSRPTWHDLAFRRVWWMSLGWAAFEAIAGIKQGYEGITLYKDVLVDVSMLRKKWTFPDHPAVDDAIRDGGPGTKMYGATGNASESLPRGTSSSGTEERDVNEGPSSHDRGRLPRMPSVDAADERQPLLGLGSVDSLNPGLNGFHESVEIEVEKDLDQLVAMRARDDLERVYGIPFIHIPVFISCLQRVNSLLLSVGFSLVLSSTYMLSIRPPHTPARILEITSRPVESVNSAPNYLAISIPLGILLQLFLYLLHTQLVLPRIGVHSVVYIGLLVSLGLFFAGLALWDALA